MDAADWKEIRYCNFYGAKIGYFYSVAMIGIRIVQILFQSMQWPRFRTLKDETKF